METNIGERGINISGGQKARISLARALYSDSDIYLLDDPISALDPNVGRDIYHECIRGYLKDKCVILVTHQIHLLSKEQNIIVMEDGKIVDRGSYNHIHNKPSYSDQDSDFSDSIRTSQLSILDNEDINLRFERINSISPKRQNSV